jgi:serine/threonine protein kinase
MLDMRLNFEDVLDSQYNSLQFLDGAISNLKSVDRGLSNFDLLREKTQNYSKDFYIQKNHEKMGEYCNNIGQIVDAYCSYSPVPIVMDSVYDVSGSANGFVAYGEVINNEFVYHQDGSKAVMVKQFKFENLEGYNEAQNLWTMYSRVATEVRAGQCLMNPLLYNFLNEKYQSILESITKRTTAVSALLEGKADKEVGLDSIAAIDCKFFTPSPSNKSVGINVKDKTTVFYLAYPLVYSNFENIFFYEPWLLTKLLKENSDFTNNLSLRVAIFQKMAEALDSLHEVGIIHKNIRIENIFVHMFTQEEGSTFASTIISIGDFSNSGVDDYDSRVARNLYTAPDEEFEIGPKFDNYQLGIAMAQLLYMIPAEGTKEISLSTIAKMLDINEKIMVNGVPKQLFEQLMFDSVYPPSNFDHYSEIMSYNAIKCNLGIFKMIYEYFKFAKYASVDFSTSQMRDAMYDFKPTSGEEQNIAYLVEYDKFKKYFMSIYLSLFPMVPDCVAHKVFPYKLTSILRGLMHPNVYLRLPLRSAFEDLYSILVHMQSDSVYNPEYQEYDYTSFIHKKTGTAFGRKKSFNMI